MITMSEPNLKRTLNVYSVPIKELEKVHTQVHVIWNRLLTGDYIENWTFDDCIRIHSVVVERKKEVNQRHHASIDSLDAQESVEAVKNSEERTPYEPSSPIRSEPESFKWVHPSTSILDLSSPVSELSDEELLTRHAVIHREFGRRPNEDNSDNTELLKAHADVMAMMKEKGMHHRIKDDLDRMALGIPLLADRGDRIYLDEILRYFRNQPITKLKEPFVSIVGGLCESGYSDQDIDILIRKKENPDEDVPLKFRIAQFIDPALHHRIHWLFDSGDYGSFTNHIPLFSEALIPIEPMTLIKMSKLTDSIIVKVLDVDQIDNVFNYEIGIPLKASEVEEFNSTFTEEIDGDMFLLLGTVITRVVKAKKNDRLEMEVRSVQRIDSKEGLYFSVKSKVSKVAPGASFSTAKDLAELAKKNQTGGEKYKFRCVVRENGKLYGRWQDAEDFTTVEAVINGLDWRDTGTEKTKNLGTWSELKEEEAISIWIDVDNKIVLTRFLFTEIGNYNVPFVSEFESGWFATKMSWLTTETAKALCTAPFKDAQLLQAFVYNRAAGMQSLLEQVEPNYHDTAIPLHNYFAELVDDLGMFREDFGKTIVPLISEKSRKEAAQSRKEDKIKPFRFFLSLKGIAGHRKNETYSIDGVLSFTKEKDYPYEVDKKYDGMRLFFHKVGKRVLILTEEGNDRTDRFPMMVAEALKHKEDFIIDAEMTGVNPDGSPMGRSDVAGYANTKGTPDDKAFTANVFDLLWVDGEDLHNKNQKERREALEKHFKPGPKLVIIDMKWAKNAKELRAAIKHFSDETKFPGTEGAMIKSFSTVYDLQGKSSEWIKFKTEADLDVEVWKITKPKGATSTFNYLGIIRDQKGEPIPVGKTFNTGIKAKKGDIIRVAFGNLNKWLDVKTKRTWYSWVFPRVLELREDKNKPDEQFTAERIVKQTDGQVGEKPWPNNFKELLDITPNQEDFIPIIEEGGCPKCGKAIKNKFKVLSKNNWTADSTCLNCSSGFKYTYWKQGVVLSTSDSKKENLSHTDDIIEEMIEVIKILGCPKCGSKEFNKLDYSDGILRIECKCGYELNETFITLKANTLFEFIKPLKPYKNSNTGKTNEFFALQDMEDLDLDNHVAELKTNGLRVQVHKKGKAIQVLTAFGNIIPNFKIGGLHVALKRLKARDGIFDGELYYDEPGATFSEVYALTRAKDIPSNLDAKKLRIIFFDVMKLNRKDLTELPFKERREILIKTVPNGKRIRYVVSNRIRNLRDIQQLIRGVLPVLGQTEGLVIKHRESLYNQSESKHWYKWVSVESMLLEEGEDILLGRIPKLTDKQLRQHHIILHRYYRKFAENKRVPGWTKPLTIKLHRTLVEELKSRGIRHSKIDGLDRGTIAEGKPTPEEEEQLKKPSIEGIKDFVVSVAKDDSKTIGQILDMKDENALIFWEDSTRSIHPIDELVLALEKHDNKRLDEAADKIRVFVNKSTKSDRRLTSLQTDPVITFLGTGSEMVFPLIDCEDPQCVEEAETLHERNASLLVEYKGFRLMIDAGRSWTGNIKDIEPDAIFLTHAHPDHCEGLVVATEIPVYATKDVLGHIKHYPIKNKKVLKKDWQKIGPFNVLPFKVTHSLKTETVGFKIKAGKNTFVYTTDLLHIPNRENILEEVDLYIGDGTTFDRPFIQRKGDTVFGHTDIRTQLKWCAKAGIQHVYFTHVGHNKRKHNDFVELIRKEYDKIKESIKEKEEPK